MGAITSQDPCAAQIACFMSLMESLAMRGVLLVGTLMGLSAGPLLVSLPYPTALLSPSTFASSSSGYLSQLMRPVRVLMLGKQHLREDQKVGSTLRQDLWDQMVAANGLSADADASGGTPGIVICAKDNTCANRSWHSIYELTSSSAFCLQPPGDTLTRSHLYVAMLSGCIPVIFDPNHRADYDDSASTAWAWRNTYLNDTAPDLAHGESGIGSSDQFFDYSKFAVVVPLAADEALPAGFLEELVSMPSKKPERFLSLRRYLAKVSAFMYYDQRDCDGIVCSDAFLHFSELLMYNKQLLDAYRSVPKS